MKYKQNLATLMLLLFTCVPTMAQSTNAALTGIVQDASGAVIPGAQVVAENTRTGVTTTATANDAGVYSFPSLQPGTYKVMAEKAGFKKLVYSEVVLELAARVTLNFPLEIGAVATDAVEINAANDTQLAIGNTSVGGVINGQKVQDLPLPGRNALGLVLTQAGLVGDNFAGARIGTLNVALDGVNVMDQRINSGVNSTVFTSVDIVDEVRVITSPADAEFGRGSGQVLLTMRSGGNQFHGSLFESHRNTVLNANDWFNNLNGVERNSLIRNQFGGRLQGPIVKNKAFFFFNYEGQRQVTGTNTTQTTFTAQARQGIYRYYPGTRNANANSTSATAPPTVDLNGNPVKPGTATGDLQALSLLGLDPNRRVADPTGVIKRYLDLLPLPNNFRVGDGLNTAGYTWNRRATSDFDLYAGRVDYKFNDKHTANFKMIREKDFELNGFLAQPFPNSPGGTFTATNNFYSFDFTSTFSSNLVNEFTAGAQRGPIRFNAPWELEAGKALLATANGQGYLPVFSTLAAASQPVRNDNDPQGRNSPLYTYTDKITYLRGRHEFKGGVEFRFVSTNGFNSFDVLPRAVIGTGGAAITGLPTTGATSLGTNLAGAQTLLNDLVGSLANVRQAFNAPGGANPVFLAGEGKQRTWKQREFSWFIRDNFKVRPNLTLNLGVRHDFYGVPFEANGKTAGLVGGSAGIFGISGSSYADLYQPGKLSGALTQIQLVGKNSPNPDTQLYAPDWNNFAPAIGFSWAIPYFGKKQTVLRAGYGMGYERNSLRILDVVAGDQPGLRTVTTFAQAAYLDLTKIGLPLTPVGKPLETVPLTDRNQTVRVFDSNLRTAYVQNWNLTIQRELFKDYVLEVRYVGNKGTKLVRGVNINETNIFAASNNETLLSAYNAVRSGGDSAFLDRVFNGINLGSGVVNGTTVRAGAGLRTNSNTRGFFSSNSVGGFANYLNTTTNFLNVRGALLRNAGLPENFFVGNPQFAGANLTGNFANSTYHSFQAEVLKRFANGLTFQSNYTWSKALGEEEGAAQEQLDSFRDGRNRRLEKRLMSFHVPHVFRNSAIYELPFGPGRKFLGSGPSFISRLVERWQFGVIYNQFAGSPLGLTSGQSTFNQFTDNTPNLVGDFPSNSGKIKKTDNGVVFFDGLKQVTDPSVASITTAQGLQALSTLLAITDANGKLLLTNPTPGTLGSLQQLYLTSPGSFRLDANLVKRIKLRESWNFELRLDAIGLTNTPMYSTFNTDINSTNFGRVTASDGERLFVVGLRLNF
jgi:hypothetical protein